MKLQLINPPVIEKYGGNSKKGAFPPLSLIALATYTKKKLPWLTIEILDGEILSFKEIEKRIDGDVVGLSANILNYPNCLKLARIAKGRKAKNILGGPYTFTMAQSIIKNREYIDAVVVGDGEKALVAFLNETELNHIPNLVYKKNSHIFTNPITQNNINTLPLPDFSFIELQKYAEHFKEYFGKTISTTNPGSIFSQKGCIWKELSGGCVYCRPEENHMSKSPIRVWKELEKLYNEYDIDFVWDVSNSFTGDKIWFQQFIEKKPFNDKLLLMIYSRPNDITLEVASGLKKINTFMVLMGADSGDNKILKMANTGKSVEVFWKAIRNLEIVDIKISVSIVLGLSGENNKTLNNTLRFIEKITKLKNFYEISAGILIPIPGTKVFKKIISIPESFKRYSEEDLFNIEDLQYTWVKNFCNISYNSLQKALEEISNISPIVSSFGKKIEENYSLEIHNN